MVAYYRLTRRLLELWKERRCTDRSILRPLWSQRSSSLVPSPIILFMSSFITVGAVCNPPHFVSTLVQDSLSRDRDCLACPPRFYYSLEKAFKLSPSTLYPFSRLPLTLIKVKLYVLTCTYIQITTVYCRI